MQIGKATRAKPGQIECGDQLIVLNGGSQVLIAVADGLGHGTPAAEAALAAMAYIAEHRGENLPQLMLDCGAAIRSTRGVALTLLRIDADSHRLKYAAVGNVEVKAISRAPIRPINSPGVVGGRISRIVQMDYTLAEGDLIFIYTDGISSKFNPEQYKRLDTQTIADAIVSEYGKDHDDATCVTIRY